MDVGDRVKLKHKRNTPSRQGIAVEYHDTQDALLVEWDDIHLGKTYVDESDLEVVKYSTVSLQSIEQGIVETQVAIEALELLVDQLQNDLDNILGSC